jgi:hypothetical protein
MLHQSGDQPQQDLAKSVYKINSIKNHKSYYM